MLTQTGLYAIQALLYLAEQSDRGRVPASTMARELGVPSTYLAKVLQRLAREGTVSAARGAGGGYRLVTDPSRITVSAAVAPFQDLRAPEACLMGGRCDPDDPCPAHERRAAWNAAVMEILDQTTLADLLTGAPMCAVNRAAHHPSEF